MSELVYEYAELEEIISNADNSRLKEISSAIYFQKGLYEPYVLNRILRMISLRLIEIGPPKS